MINAERENKFRAGKERSPKTEILSRNFRSGRKRNTFTTVAGIIPRVALLNTYDKNHGYLIDRVF